MTCRPEVAAKTQRAPRPGDCETGRLINLRLTTKAKALPIHEFLEPEKSFICRTSSSSGGSALIERLDIPHFPYVKAGKSSFISHIDQRGYYNSLLYELPTSSGAG